MMRAGLFSLMLFVAACGGGAPSSLDVCHITCDALKRCGINSDAQAVNCHNNCDNMKGTFSDQDAACDKTCTNCGDRRSQTAACESMECNKIIGCTTAVDQTCIGK
jgi:hypothetical protein